MIAELGHYCLILALCLALVQAILPLVGAKQEQVAWMGLARPLAFGQLTFISLAFIALAYCFLANDFSVAYVAANSNSQLPAIYRFCAVWGAHEGSLLLWVFLLNVWSVGVALFSRNLPLAIVAQVLSVLGIISCGFLVFLLFTSNPFTRLLPDFPLDGQDLNPLLQDPGLIIHPPMLYMGYVGFSVAFAFAITALLSGKLDAVWARWAKPWSLVAWCFLTFGIVLGSWWAYRELGWGGWWFWDPVENASFLPWLSGTALLHSLSVCEKRNAFKAWTVLLAIITFSLSLLGTFIVRSGVLISVHSFAVDPLRGVFMLIFLGTVIGVSLTLYAWRISKVRSPIYFANFSRESFLLANNILLTAMMLCVLLGTLYPLIIDSLGFEKLSVGPPYFNLVFIPFMAIALFFMGFAPFSQWRLTETTELRWQLFGNALLVVALALILPWLAGQNLKWGVVGGLGLAFWVVLASLENLFERGRYFLKLKKLPLSQWGMTLAHIGLAVTVIGVVLVSNYSVQREVRLSPAEQINVGKYDFQFLGTRAITGPNYSGYQAGVLVKDQGRSIALLQPEQREFNVQHTVLAKTAIKASVFRDLYVALGEHLDNNSWSLRIYYKPFVRWIWGGGLLMILGGMLAAFDRRYRILSKAQP